MPPVDSDVNKPQNEPREFDQEFADFARDEPAPAASEPEDQQDPADQDRAPAAPSDAEAAVADASAAPAPPDPWANATPEQIAERDRLTRAVQASTGAQSALQRQVNELRKKQQAQPEPKADEAADGADDDADLARLREDYPDVAEPILRRMAKFEARLTSTEKVATTVVEDRAAADVQSQLQALSASHPDFQAYAPGGKSAEEFEAWLGGQSPRTQALAESMDAGDTSALLTLFKARQGAPAPTAAAPAAAPTPDARRQKQLDGSRDVAARQAPALTGAPSDFEGSFAYYAAKADKEAAAAR